MKNLVKVLPATLLVIVGIVVFVVGGGWFANMLSSEPWYFFPRAAADWAAWGTWVGSLATASALAYAALTFIQDTRERQKDMDAREKARLEEAQRHEQLIEQKEKHWLEDQKKADENHRQLVEEARSEAYGKASQVSWEVGAFKPALDDVYASVYYENLQARHPITDAGSANAHQEEYWPRSYDSEELHVIVSNRSKTDTFTDLSLQVFTPVGPIALLNKRIRSPLPPEGRPGSAAGDPSPWTDEEITALDQTKAMEKQLGDLAPNTQMHLTFSTANSHYIGDWAPPWEGPDDQYVFPSGEAILRYSDAQKRYWSQTTQSLGLMRIWDQENNPARTQTGPTQPTTK